MGTVLNRSRLPPRSVLGAPHWGAAPEPAGETAPPNVHGGQPSALLALLTAGNCRNPYRDTVENGSTLGKSGIHDTQFDVKAPKPTPKNRKIDALEKSLNDRLCRAK